jgi:hypothetical protein
MKIQRKYNIKRKRTFKKKQSKLSIIKRSLKAFDAIYRPLEYTYNLATDISGNILDYKDLATSMQATSDWTAMIGAYKRYYVTSCYVTIQPNGSDAQDGTMVVGYHPYQAAAPTTYNQVTELQYHTSFPNKRGGQFGFPVKFTDGVDSFKSIGATWVFGTLQFAATSNTLSYGICRVTVKFHVYWSAWN